MISLSLFGAKAGGGWYNKTNLSLFVFSRASGSLKQRRKFFFVLLLDFNLDFG
jgi:hypothetical protein